MPRYAYRCRTCDQRFELQRSMSEAADPAPCPDGHDDTGRVLSMFATVGTSAGGGCCGGACGCSH